MNADPNALLLVMTVLLAGTEFTSAVNRHTTYGDKFTVGFGANYEPDVSEANLTITVNTLDQSTRVRIQDQSGARLADYEQPPHTSVNTLVNYTKYAARVDGKLAHNGLEIKTSEFVSAFVSNSEFYSIGATALFPTCNLGKDYVIGMYEVDLELAPGCFQVVATADNTQLQFNLTSSANLNGAAVAAGHASFTLPHALDSVTLCHSDALTDLSGSTVHANRDVAVFAFDTCSNIPDTLGGCDFTLEQMVPNFALGTETIVIPVASRTAGDIVRVVAVSDHTTVKLNGQQVASLNAGQFAQLNTPSNASSYLTTSKPAQFFQFSKGNEADASRADPFMTTLPSIPFWLSDHTFATIRNFDSYAGGYRNYMSIAILTAQKSTVRINGASPAGSSALHWKTVSANSLYSTAQVELDSGAGGVYHVSSTNGTPMEVQVYGLRESAAYGFSAGQAFKSGKSGL